MSPPGPHANLPVTHPRERLLAALFDRLWDTYRTRVAHVRAYERVIAAAGATFINDHLAFRTIAMQQPTTGIVSLARLFEVLGYAAAGCYQFPDKHLSSIHFQHPNGHFPKLFISELRSWEFDEPIQLLIHRTLQTHRAPISEADLARLSRVSDTTHAELLELVTNQIEELPWSVPERDDVTALNDVSQFGAWVLVHGYRVNHFTALVNSHGVARLSDIEGTVAALQHAGIPLKSEIEGARGSKLRQTATEAATIEVPVRERGRLTTLPWSYAYFELAERGLVTDPETGRRGRFEGFLGPQATNLFEMTRGAVPQ